MTKPFDGLVKDWPRERLARVEARARQLIAEELTLRQDPAQPQLSSGDQAGSEA